MTAQIAERICLEGEDLYMTFCPPLPEHHPRVVEREDLSAERSTVVHSTACWRRYQGSWEVLGGRFFLTGVEGCWQLLEDDPLFADWFSGVLRVPRGEMLQYVHMGFGSVYEEEIHVTVERGQVVSIETLDNRNRDHDRGELALRNLPGWENRFEGDGKGPWSKLPAPVRGFLSRMLGGRPGAS